MITIIGGTVGFMVKICKYKYSHGFSNLSENSSQDMSDMFGPGESSNLEALRQNSDSSRFLGSDDGGFLRGLQSARWAIGSNAAIALTRDFATWNWSDWSRFSRWSSKRDKQQPQLWRHMLRQHTATTYIEGRCFACDSRFCSLVTPKCARLQLQTVRLISKQCASRIVNVSGSEEVLVFLGHIRRFASASKS